jgi:hypothetical protein
LTSPERFQIDPSKVVHETVEGEVILIQLDTGNYYSLRGSGAEIWALLDRGGSAPRIAAELRSHYTDDGTIAEAVHGLLGRLAEEDLIVAAGEGNGAGARSAQYGGDLAGVRPFDPPVLEKYTDMQQYLLVDPVHDVDERGWPGVREAAS